MKKEAHLIRIPSRIHLISLPFFLSCSCLLEPLFASDDGLIPVIPMAGSQASQNHGRALQKHGEKESGQRYRIRILEAQKDQKASHKQILIALNATNGLVRKIQDKVAEKCKRLSLPDLFIEELKEIKLVEPYGLFETSQWRQLATQCNKGNLAPFMEAIYKNLDTFFNKWDTISRNIGDTLTLAINQTLWPQGEWSALFGQGSHGTITIKGCDLYKWVASFYKALASLQISDDNLQPTEQEALSSSDLPGFLSTINKDLTFFYTEKNGILWELTTFFLQTLPEYEALPNDFFLLPYPCEWLIYFSSLSEAWPTSENWHQKGLTELIDSANEFQLTLKNKDNLSQQAIESIRDFWCKNGKGLWDLLKESMKNLPKYDQLLDNLYPSTQDFEKALIPGRLLKLLKILDLWRYPMIPIRKQILDYFFLKQMLPPDISGHCILLSYQSGSHINIPHDLSNKLGEVFSPSEAWEEKTGQFKKKLKPFSNTRFIINLLPKLKIYYKDFERKYQDVFGKTYDTYAPVVSGTMLDGTRFVLPQSMACTVFPALYEQVTYLLEPPFKNHFAPIPSIQCFHHDLTMDVGREYAWYFLEKLFGLPSLPTTLALFENILIHRPSMKIAVNFASEFGMRSQHLTDIKDPINYQRELRLQGFLKDSENWRPSFKTGLGVIQEQFTGMFLEEFLKEVAKGKRSSFDQFDADSFGRQILFTMLTQSSVPLENWGLVEEDGKLVLVRVNRASKGDQNLSFLHPIFQYLQGINSKSPYLSNRHVLIGQNILYFLPFAHQEVSTVVREEFLSHDSLLMLSHWMTELTKIQGHFDDLMGQKNASSIQQPDEITQDQGIGELKISAYRGMIKEFIHNFKVMQKVLQGSNVTYLKLLKKLRPQEYEYYEHICQSIEGEMQYEGRVALFFNNIILPFIGQLKGTSFDHDTLAAAQRQCIIDLGYNSGLSIETLLSRIQSNSIKHLFMSMYEMTKEGAFVKADEVLRACEYFINKKGSFVYEGLYNYDELLGKKQKNPWPIERVYFIDSCNNKPQPLFSKKSLEEKAFDLDAPMIEDFISLADISKNTPEQQVEIISLLLKLQPQPRKIHPSWQNLFQTITDSDDPAFIRKFLTIYPRLRHLFEQSLGKSSVADDQPKKSSLKKKISSKSLTLQRDIMLKEKVALYEFQHYPAQIQVYEKHQKKKQAPEKVAGDLFRQIWYGSLESLTLEEDALFNALLDLLLLPRYAGLTELPEELRAMAGYLESTGFASHNHQHVGRSKSSHSGPINLELGDGQHYVLSWSERCATLLQSPKTIPARICQTIASHDISLLCLEWLHQLQKDGINITFYPWFIETVLEKATQMQKLMVTRSVLTFQEVMQDLWPPIFYAYGQQFKTIPDAQNLCKHLKDLIKQFHDLVTINSNVDLDWMPDGKSENLDFILEKETLKQTGYFSRPPLSLTDAAVEVLNYYIPKSCGSIITGIIFDHAAKLQVNGQKMSLNKRYSYSTAEAFRKKIRRLINNLIQGSASRQAIQCAVSLMTDHKYTSKEKEKQFNRLLKIADRETIQLAINWYLDWGSRSYSQNFLPYDREGKDMHILNFIKEQSSLEAQKIAIALYLDCSVNCIDVHKDSLKISGIKKIDVMKLRFLVPIFSKINNLDISNNNISNASLESLFFTSEDNSFGNGMGSLKNLETLNISGNPVYDPSPLCKYPQIKNIVTSDTYIPGGNFLKHMMLFSGFSDLSPDNIQIILKKMEMKQEVNNNKKITWNRHSFDEIDKIIPFYNDQLIALEQIHRIPKLYVYSYDTEKKNSLAGINYGAHHENFIKNLYFIWEQRKNPYNSPAISSYHNSREFYEKNIYYVDEQYNFDVNAAKILNLYYNGIAANIVDQMAQNFWDIILENRAFLTKNSKLFTYICEVLTDPGTNASEASRKLIFALRHRLASGVPSDDLVWNKDRKTCTLPKLNIPRGTAQTYLDYLTHNLRLLSEEKGELSKAWYARVIALAADQLASNFWEEALTFEEKNKELLKILTSQNATVNALKLAFAWQYDLPKETHRDDLGFILDSLRQPVITSHPYTLTALTISGLDLSNSKLGFLAPFTGKYQITVHQNPQSIPNDILPNELILSMDKDLICKVQNKDKKVIRTKDFEAKQQYLVKKFKGYVKKGRWEVGVEYQKENLIKFTLAQGYTFSGLTILQLPQCDLISTSFLPPMENLTHLNLYGNKIKGLSGLYDKTIFKFPILKALNLSHNILDFTLGDWNEWKKEFSHIKEIDFSHNNISTLPVMNQCLLPENSPMEGKQTFFKIDHNNINISDLHKFYDFSLFSKERTLEEMNAICPKSKNQHPIHFYHQQFLNEVNFYCQVYEVSNGEDNKKTIKFFGDEDRILRILKTLSPYTEENKNYLFSLIIKHNINTSRLSILPQNNTK